MVYHADASVRPQIKPSNAGSKQQQFSAGEDFLPWTVNSPIAVGNDLRVPYTHFALIGLDANGNVRTHTSSSLEKSHRLLFSPDFQERFIRSTGTRVNGCGNTFTGEMYSSPQQVRHHTRTDINLSAPYMSRKRRRESHVYPPSDRIEYKRPQVEDTLPHEKANRIPVEIGNEEKIVSYYNSAFMALQQLNCRQIAKAYIKSIEPRKQVKHPYNGGRGGPGEKGDPERTKPAWWPANVIHREPDHLKKPDRIQLLIHIFRNLEGTDKMSADELEEAAQEAHRKIEPPERREVLDEIYRVRRAEESYERGEIDANTIIYVANREPPSKAAEREDTVSDAGPASSPVDVKHPDAEPTESVSQRSEQPQPDQQQQQQQQQQQHRFATETGLPLYSPHADMHVESKPSTQTTLDYFAHSGFVPSPAEQPNSMMGQWHTFQQHPVFVPVDYGTGPAEQMMGQNVMPPQQQSSQSPHTSLPLSDLSGARNQPSFEYMSPPMGSQQFRTGSLSHPHLLPQGGVVGESASHYK